MRQIDALYATEATRVTEEMFIVVAKALAEEVTEQDLSTGLIYPPQSHILQASLHVVERVAAYRRGQLPSRGSSSFASTVRARI